MCGIKSPRTRVYHISDHSWCWYLFYVTLPRKIRRECIQRIFLSDEFVQSMFTTDVQSNIVVYYLFGYRQGYITEQCLTVMLELWRKAIDSKGTAGAILTDLSKAFDCLNHNLLLTKMDAYGFEKSVLMFIQNYLKENESQRVI